jgi:glucose-6-phosphate 1-dehydrogenase
MAADQAIIYDGTCEDSTVGPCAIVIFGASGDLTKRKLIPAFFRLYQENKLPKSFYIIGFARSKMDDISFQKMVKDILKTENDASQEVISFTEKCFYYEGQYDDINSFLELKKITDSLNVKYSTGGNMIYQLSTPPVLYAPIVDMLGKSGLLIKNQIAEPYHRVIFEKPFGRDHKSAVELNKNIRKHASDTQVYRIDHYLGKDTVQNIFVFRFANSIFERVWNRDNIDHIQITVSEDIGIGSRAGYFNESAKRSWYE